MNTLVIGASRGTGRLVTSALLDRGHQVTALARSAGTHDADPRARVVAADVLDPAALAAAVAGHEAVVVTLGISDNPLLVRLGRPTGTPPDIRSRGTAAVVAAMQAGGVRRLVVQTTYGLGETAAGLDRVNRLVFALLLKPQIEDSARQEEVVRASNLDWTLVRPVNLTDVRTDSPAHVDPGHGNVGMKVSRHQVARVIAEAVDDPGTRHQALAVSAR